MHPSNGRSATERHGVSDFAVDPVDGIVWVLLERPPSQAWIAALELLVIDGVSGAAVTVEAGRLSLPRGALDEIDALGALLALTSAANGADPRPTPDADR
jgi:hypothetical protein